MYLQTFLYQEVISMAIKEISEGDRGISGPWSIILWVSVLYEIEEDQGKGAEDPQLRCKTSS